MYASSFCIENSQKVQSLKSKNSPLKVDLVKSLNIAKYTAILTSIFLGTYTFAANNPSPYTIKAQCYCMNQ